MDRFSRRLAGGKIQLENTRVEDGVSQCRPWIASPASENVDSRQTLAVTGDIQTLLASSPKGTYLLLGVMENGQSGKISWAWRSGDRLYGSRSAKLSAGDVAVYRMSQK